MAEPFRNSTLPSLIDFGNEENDDSSFDEWSRNEDSMAEKTNNPREKHLTSLGSLMESRSDSAPFEFNKIDRRNRDHHQEFRPQFDNDGSSTNHQPSTNPFQSPQSTLDQFLCTNQQPTFTSLPPGVLEDDDTMYTQITTHASSLSLKASGVSSSEKINNPNPSSSGHRRSGASSFDSLKFSEQEFVNARSSFSSAEANDLPEVTATTDTFQVPEMKWVEFDDFDTIKSRDEERDDFMYAGHVPGHRKTSSYGQQPVWQASNGDMIKRSGMRKHSLDEKMPKHLTNMYHSAERSRSETYAINGDRLHGNPFLDDLKVEGIPEFIGNGGGEGIYKAPVRAAIHPGRPPSFELRPHPLRETQVGRFMRTINYMDGQLWAGTECGIRFWNLSEVFMNCGEEGLVPGDEETAPFYESSKTSPTLCLLPDVSSKLIWTGHKDGKIRTWKMDVDNSDGHMVKQIIAWQAHKGPVFCLAMTSYGDLWSGSEAGATKVWPGEAVEKALSLVDQGRHMAVIGIERSFIDLKSQVTVGGVCCLPPYDVKFMLADTCRGKVWSGAYLTFALWDARTRDLLKVYGLDGQSEIRADISSIHDSNVEDEMKVKFVTSTKKEKPQSSLNFFQRSRNALIGAADAVRRVAAKGPFGDDVRRTEALVISMDGMIWTGCANGSLVQWDGNGNRVQEFHHHPYPVQCMCTTGTRIWIGYASGMVQIINIDGKLLGGWVAHGSAVMKIVVGSGYVFTLAHHGGIRAWSMSSPHPLDEIVRTELSKKDYLYMKQENIRILAGTWNVGQERASPDSLISWIGSSASDVAIVVVGFQEVEMGAGVLAMAAAKESVGLEGSANGQWWLENIGKTLDEGTTFERVGSRQLAGLLIAIWVRKSLQPYIGDMDVAAVPCGFGRAIGNKGAVALKMRVFHRIFCFVNCHFAAHLEAVNRRNADFDHVYRTMVFSRSTNAMTAVAAGVSSAVHYLRGVNIPGMQPEENKPELADSDMVVFLGDFNYRLHSISYDEARDFVSQRCFDWLREKDQLRAEMKAGRVFQGMREGVITFPPTYKFERHVSGLAGYDSSEKKRIPAWCDRILYRDNRGSSSLQCSLECPVVSSIIHYDACMDATDSDHKPVRCIFQVDIARIDEWIRRHEFGNIILSNASIQSMLRDVNVVPEAVLSTNNILLQNQEKSLLRITNKCSKSKAVFSIVCKGENTIKDDGTTEFKQRNAYGLPRWLQVTPATGVIRPGQVFEVTVHHEDHTQEEFIDGKPQNWWCEDTRDKEVMLDVNVSGSGSMEMRSHQVWVRHCISSKSSSSSKEQAKRTHANHLQRTDNKQIPESSDIVENLKTRNWHNP